jgi:Alcohol dehydrogenase GroES-like domain
MEHRFPVVLGKDFAGTFEAVGEGVTGFTAGQQDRDPVELLARLLRAPGPIVADLAIPGR